MVDLLCMGEPMLEFNQLPPDPDGRVLYLEGHGGDTSNAAIAAARQGARVGYITAIGKDAPGDSLMALWAREAVDTATVTRTDQALTGVYFVTHDERGHHFLYYRKDSPAALHEFRQVISVDGQAISAAATARHSLALGLASADDHARKRMLEDFQKYGLATAVVDFGPLLLLFTKRQTANYHFELAGDDRIGADQVKIVSYAQISGPAYMLVFQGHRAIHQPIQGRIYARVPDGLPLRIAIVESRQDGKTIFRDEAVVDYTPNAQGFVAPAAVTHKGFAGDQLMVEDQFSYTAFRKFGADAEIKFDTQQ